ncbi:hypothetical protein [Luteolibacter sp. AS25]|uniref:hypothetical protein n=1 Tax=Luteolibacter sp. AS25 TaxID=3135776 RepID=UPI00398A5512
MEQNTQTNSWPALAIGLYDKLTERNAEIIYEVENLEVQVPAKTGVSADSATWKVNGIMKIRTRNNAH